MKTGPEVGLTTMSTTPSRPGPGMGGAPHLALNECRHAFPGHLLTLFVLPCSAENGEKEEVPETPPEPPKKAAPPPPPPKKEGAGGAGLEFWGELEVQRVKFLVRTQQGHPKPPLRETQHSHDFCPHPVLEPTCAQLTSEGKPVWAEGRDVPRQSRTWAQGSIFRWSSLGPSASPCPQSLFPPPCLCAPGATCFDFPPPPLSRAKSS